ncbi:MAG: cytochrome c biogenesis protein CcsA [Bacteroidaceae bacterium]|nr:cytochrome c biogenesis protein CcsA [Bacteroidaceae bacterium]
MDWSHFIYFAIAAILCWAAAAYLACREVKPVAVCLLTTAGLAVFFSFIVGLWMSLERPPLRTMGETRLWYSFFLPLAGLVTYIRWRYKWILGFSTLMATVFICVNLFKPEIHSKTLMPALQSPWFAPHVIVYMFCYAILGAAFLMAVYMLLFRRGKDNSREMEMTDNLVSVGIAFMTFGMLFGAIWAKEAWGHYWAWDPKETWAAITWLCYLLYIHLRLRKSVSPRAVLCILVFAFCCLQMCWWGINYLPSAQGISVHTYNLN